RITVVCAQGLVRVNGKNPRGGALASPPPAGVDVLSGDGNARVDPSGVGPDTGFGQRDLPGGFGHGTGAAADLGGGNDRYIGGPSAFNLVLAGPGDDTLAGGGGPAQPPGGGGGARRR